MMTTMAALLGALPLVLERGAGSELRSPLGVTIIGGLLLSQFLTLYTTPAIYLAFERLRLRFSRGRRTRERRPGGMQLSGQLQRMGFSAPFIARPGRHHPAVARPAARRASSPIASCRSPRCRASISPPSW